MGCGDIARRAIPHLHRYRLFALIRNRDDSNLLRGLNVTPIVGDLDQPATLTRLRGLAHTVLHFAPPQNHGKRDLRTAKLLAALAKRSILPQRLIYISTSGVYGDCNGEWIDETHPLLAQTPRAIRRVDAERRLRLWGQRNSVAVSILRVPGIYAAERLPLERLHKGTAVLQNSDDVYTNHIHADDLAQAVIAALHYGRPGRAYNIVDDSNLKMGDYFDLVADHFGITRPPRISRAEAVQTIPANLLSFMSESRRLKNSRMKQELRVQLQFPHPLAALAKLKEP